MVKITNGVNTFEVTTGAYENNFKKLGYKIVKEKEVKVVEEKTEEVTKEEKTEEKLLEKPLSNWTKTEVKKFAEEHEIDLFGTKNIDEAKQRISAYLDK